MYYKLLRTHANVIHIVFGNVKWYCNCWRSNVQRVFLICTCKLCLIIYKTENLSFSFFNYFEKYGSQKINNKLYSIASARLKTNDAAYHILIRDKMSHPFCSVENNFWSLLVWFHAQKMKLCIQHIGRSGLYFLTPNIFQIIFAIWNWCITQF